MFKLSFSSIGVSCYSSSFMTVPQASRLVDELALSLLIKQFKLDNMVVFYEKD